MKKTIMKTVCFILIALILCGCQTHTTEPTSDEPFNNNTVSPKTISVNTEQLMKATKELFDQTAKQVVEMKEQHQEDLINAVLTSETGANPDVIEAMHQELQLAPPHVLQTLIDNNWKVIVCNGGLGAREGLPYSIAGSTYYDEKCCYIDNRITCPRRAGLHEIGHAIDNIYGDISQSEEFQVIYYEERYSFQDITSMGDGHESSDLREFFASVYQNYIINPDGYQYAPKAYDFVSHYM